MEYLTGIGWVVFKSDEQMNNNIVTCLAKLSVICYTLYYEKLINTYSSTIIFLSLDLNEDNFIKNNNIPFHIL